MINIVKFNNRPIEAFSELITAKVKSDEEPLLMPVPDFIVETRFNFFE